MDYNNININYNNDNTGDNNHQNDEDNDDNDSYYINIEKLEEEEEEEEEEEDMDQEDVEVIKEFIEIDMSLSLPHAYEDYFEIRKQVKNGTRPVHTILHVSVEQYQEYFYENISHDIELTLLVMAMRLHDDDFVKFLLNSNVNVSVVPRGCELPLLTAILMRNIVFVDEIISAGAEINERSQIRIHDYLYYCSPIELAVIKNEPEILNLLISRGGYINIPNPVDNVSALHLAVQHSSYEAMKILLSWDANVDLVTDVQIGSITVTETPLSAVIKQGLNLKAVKWMLKNLRMDINFIDSMGFSYLHHAVFLSRNPRMVAYLLDAGIEISVPDGDGSFAVEYQDENDPTCQLCVNLVRGHIVKMILAGFDMCRRNMKAIHGISFGRFPMDCFTEVSKMKEYHLYTTELTCYTLLHLSLRQAAKKLEGVDITRCFYKEIFTEFPIYAGMIIHRLDRARRYSLGHYS